MATQATPTKKTRIPRFDGDSRTFLLLDSAGEVEYGPTLYCNCHQRLNHVHNWNGKIVHKSDPGHALPVPKGVQQWNALKPIWEPLVNGGVSN
jgi:hypothetical protein